MNELDQKLNTFFNEIALKAIELNNQYWYLIAITLGIFLCFALITKVPFLRLIFLFVSIVGLGFEYALFEHKNSISHYYNTYLIGNKKYFVVSFISIFIVAVFVTFLLTQEISKIIDLFIEKISRKNSLERLTDTDIRTIGKVLPKRKPYNPFKYFRKKYICLGVNEKGKPSYISFNQWKSKHVQISGTTGCGKGVFAAMLCVQALRNGETVIVFDPKNDEFLAHVLADQCRRQKLQFVFIDLLNDVPQISLFKNKSLEQKIELLSTGFNLADSGAEADFYKLFDRKAASTFAQYISENDKPLRQSVIDFSSKYNDLLKEAPKFAEALNEISQLNVLQAIENHWVEYIEQGTVLYVRGSMRNPRVLKLQKMFLLFLMQQCESRERSGAKSVLFFLDEFKYLISRESMEALGAIRDKNAHVILAHQSIGDLRNSPVGLEPESVIASVNENCSLKFIYQVHDPDTADHFARMTGNIMIDRETRTFNRNSAFTEVTDPTRSIRQDQRHYIDTNVFHSLPERCGVLLGNGLAQLLFTSPIKTKMNLANVTPTEFEEPFDKTKKNKTNLTIEEELINVDP